MTWGKARVEVTSLKGEILRRLAEGWPIRKVHATLVQEHQLTISYQRFHHYVQRFRAESERSETQSSVRNSSHQTPKSSDQRAQQSTAASTKASPPLARGQLMVQMPHDDDPEATAHALIYGAYDDGEI